MNKIFVILSMLYRISVLFKYLRLGDINVGIINVMSLCTLKKLA